MLWFSCSKKNDSTTTSSAITGKWYLATDSIAEYTNGTLTDHEFTTYNRADYTVFNTNGSGYSVTPNGAINDSVKFTYKLSGSALTLNYPTQLEDGNLEVEAFSVPATVTLLNSSKLSISIDTSAVINGATEREVEFDTFTR